VQPQLLGVVPTVQLVVPVPSPRGVRESLPQTAHTMIRSSEEGYHHLRMKVDSVTQKLLVGPDLREADDFQQLLSLNVSAVLSLQTEEDLRNRGMNWEEHAATVLGLVYRNIPVTDFNPADLQRRLPECVAVLERLLKDGHTVYVHCTAGVIRSPTVVVAYLHWCEGWKMEEALNRVRQIRSCTPDTQAIRAARE
jgi:protein-tyrosine phosphatase